MKPMATVTLPFGALAVERMELTRGELWLSCRGEAERRWKQGDAVHAAVYGDDGALIWSGEAKLNLSTDVRAGDAVTIEFGLRQTMGVVTLGG